MKKGTVKFFNETKGFGFYASGSAYLEGSINATAGEIGGWTIEPGKIQSGQITLNSGGGSGQIIAGTLTSYSPNTTNYGFFADSLGNVLIKGSRVDIENNNGGVNIKANTIINDISKNGGQIINKTKENAIPFPDLNMAGFLKQTMGIQKVFQGLTFGVPKLSNPLTLASGVKDIVKGLEGAKNFVEATLNLEFLEKEVLTTKTIGEIKASLPIPAGLLNVVGSIDDFADDVEGTLKKVDDFKKDNEEKFKQAAELSSAIDNLVPTGIARVLEEIPADELSQIPGAQDVLDVVSSEGSTLGGIKIKDLTENDIANAREFGVFGDLEDYVAEQGSIQQDIEQAKFIGKILNLTKQEQ